MSRRGGGRRMDELELINRFFREQTVHRGDVALGIGDDAAVVRPTGGGELVTTTDAMVAGVHFPEGTAPEDIGYKALAVNLSDVAAMGATPAWATLAITLPEADEAWLAAFASGFLELAARHDVQLVGGDTSRGPLTVSVQVTGLVGEAGYLTRGGAGEGDLLLVSGTLGDAALGLRLVNGELEADEAAARYLVGRLNRPEPRVALGRALAGLATAAIDVSDGLAADLGHLCAASGAGAVVDIADLPLSAAYRGLLESVGPQPALTFGDDYELCFAVRPEALSAVEALGRESGTPVTRIGRITGRTLTWLKRGETFAPGGHGYRHFG